MHKIQYINDKNITSYLKGELRLKSESKTENNIIRNIKARSLSPLILLDGIVRSFKRFQLVFASMMKVN
mgnify:CR=1 FL=1